MEEEKKLGRKFFVWLTWLIIAILALIVFIVVLAVTKSIPDNLVDLLDSVLTYLFFISLTYLGVNFGQKIGLAYAGNKINVNTEEIKEAVETSTEVKETTE